MEIITAYAVKNDCYKAAQQMTPIGIVLHSTGANNPNLKRYVDCKSECGTNWYNNHWNNPSSKIGEKCNRITHIVPTAQACHTTSGFAQRQIRLTEFFYDIEISARIYP